MLLYHDLGLAEDHLCSQIPERIQVLSKMKGFWNEFVSCTHRHGLDAMVSSFIKETEANEVFPSAVVDYFDRRMAVHWINQGRLVNTFNHITTLFETCDISFCPIKGIALLSQFPDLFNIRQFSDIDLLIHNDQAIRAIDILASNEFCSVPFKGKAHKRWADKMHHHYPPLYKQGCAVEVHTRLFSYETSQWSQRFLNASMRASNKERGLIWPEATQHLLYLICHLDRHSSSGQFQLRLLRDIALLAQRDDDLWRSLERLARQFEVVPSFERVRFMLDDLCKLSPWRGSGYLNNKVVTIRATKKRNLVANIPDWRNRLRVIINFVFPSQEYMKYYQKDRCQSKLFLLYMIRILNMIRRKLSSRGT